MPLTKEKKKLNKLIQSSDSEESEHELSHYVNDRVKLMKQVLKTIKPKKIKAMAPTCLKNMEIEEINSMLLEELLGISNKRLKYIFQGKNLNDDSSSTTSEEDMDIISLDDISDDELIINADNDNYKAKKLRKGKEKAVKKEKADEANKKVDTSENLMSVLELLELQARARAIKSQLLIENAKTQQSLSLAKNATVIEEKIGSDDDIIIETVKGEEIVIESTDSENERDNTEKTIAEIIQGVTMQPERETNELKDTENIEEKASISDVIGSKIEEGKTVEDNVRTANEENEDIQRNDAEENIEKKIIIIENKEIIQRAQESVKSDGKVNVEKENTKDDEEIIIINLSDDEMDKIE